MSKLETITYIVGPKRSWEFQFKHLKRAVTLLLLVFIGLGGSIAYQYFMRLHEKEQLRKQVRQEQIRNEKLISRIKKAGEQDPEWEQQILSQSTQQKKLNEQQAALIDQQVEELAELKSILQQRERVVQQFQLGKKSTQEQINTLQAQARALQQQLQSAQSLLTESKTENQKAQIQITKLETKLSRQQKQLKRTQKTASTAVAVKKQKSGTSATTAVSIENLKIQFQNGSVNVNYNLTNQTNRLQTGRAGVYIYSRQNLEQAVPYAKRPSTPYKIRRFRVISKKFTKVKPKSFVRIIVWNNKKKVLIDESYPLKQ